ncbi:fibronectin type III domain-containing protein, partial [Marinimicrococcus flavescens]|nr:fibronectin type III domain-containing protein [Marinimicrococcus flavescens]
EHEPEALKLTWTGSTDDMGVESYQLSYKKTDAPDWSTVNVPHQETVTTFTYTLSQLDPFSVYAIMLRAKDAAGNSSDAVMGLEATPGTNLVSNSGFESGSVEPWETTGTVQTVTYDTYSGGYALKLLNESGIKTAEMAAEGDVSYLVSYWSRSSADTSVPPATVSLAVYQDNDI